MGFLNSFSHYNQTSDNFDLIPVFQCFHVEWLRNIKLDCLIVFKESGWRLKRKVMEGHISKTRHSQNMF